MKFFQFFISFLFIQITLGGFAQAPNINGMVKNTYSTLIPNVYVQLLNSRYETYTDKTGAFSFSQFPAGEYVLQTKNKVMRDKPPA